MAECFLCTVEDTFLVTGRGLIIAPAFPVSTYRFEANQQVRVVRPNGETFEGRAFFQIPFQSPPARELSFLCALPDVEKDSVPVGSEIWILGKTEGEIRTSATSSPSRDV